MKAPSSGRTLWWEMRLPLSSIMNRESLRTSGTSRFRAGRSDPRVAAHEFSPPETDVTRRVTASSTWTPDPEPLDVATHKVSHVESDTHGGFGSGRVSNPRGVLGVAGAQ